MNVVGLFFRFPEGCKSVATTVDDGTKRTFRPPKASLYTVLTSVSLPQFSNLTHGSRPTPKPTGTQVVIQVKAVSLNARDCQIANGSYPAPIQVQAGIVAGSDAAGDVVAVGPDVTRVAVRLLYFFLMFFRLADALEWYRSETVSLPSSRNLSCTATLTPTTRTRVSAADSTAS